MADPINLDPIDVPDPNVPPQPAPQPAPANNQAQPPQPVARPLIARIRGLSMTNWLIAGLIAVVVIGLVVNFKKTPKETPKDKSAVADASSPAVKTTDAASSASPEADYEAKVKELKAKLEEAKVQRLKDEILKLEDELRKTARGPVVSVGLDPADVPAEPAVPFRPKAARKVAPAVASESLYSLPRLPKVRKGDLSTEDLAAEVSRFTGTAVPALVSYKNEEEAVATDNRVGWLVALMCSNAPASQRVKAAQELSYHPSKGVAQALSFTIGGGRLRTLDQFASVREAATISLGEVGDITFLPLLVQRSKDDPSPEVRKAAYDAAEKIKARASE